MKYRTAQLMAATSIVPAGTTILNITGSDIISRITCIIRLVNSSWVPTGHPAVAITSVQVMDGSDVLHNMSGWFSQAMSFYSSRKQPYNAVSYTPPASARASVPIYFGRYLYDPKFALDPTKFKNLQLKIAHNYLLGGAVPNAATLEVWADYFDENPPSPMGFLMAKSIWQQTMVASSTYYVTLPIDYPIRLLAPAAFSNTEEPDININNFRVTENGDKKILLDIDTMNHIRMTESMWPDWMEFGDGMGVTTTDRHFYFAPEKNLRVNFTSAVDSASVQNQAWSGGGMVNLYQSVGVACNSIARGRCPFGVVPIPMGDMDDPDSWWDVSKAVSPRIMIVTGAPGVVSPDFELLVQQARSY